MAKSQPPTPIQTKRCGYFYSSIAKLYDLVSRGSSGGECRGFNSGTGAGYNNLCIHSGTIASIDANTVWYNYGTASAGTIIGTSNTANAIQSICPKGWALPSSTQIDSITGGIIGSSTYVASFLPISGGYYSSNTLIEHSQGRYWGNNQVEEDYSRYFMQYRNNNLYTTYGARYTGHYIRCVSSS